MVFFATCFSVIRSILAPALNHTSAMFDMEPSTGIIRDKYGQNLARHELVCIMNRVCRGIRMTD